MKVNLVFEGGGVLGISFVGAYKALIDNGFEVGRCAGTSAGSVIATLIQAGFKANEMIDLLEETNFKQFFDKTKLSKMFLIGKPLSLIFNDGIYKSQCIEHWMNEVLALKGIRNFQDLKSGYDSLKIIAADITKRKMLILPEDLEIYGINPKTFSIASAVQMSCAIPFFYTPVKIHQGKMYSYIVDGGLLSTFPIWVFDVDNEPKRPTFGLKIKDKSSLSSQGKKSIFAYMIDMINAPINRDEMSYVRDKDLVRTILIDNNHELKSTDFDLSKDDIDYLYQVGYDSVCQFLSNWSYSDYIKSFLL